MLPAEKLRQELARYHELRQHRQGEGLFRRRLHELQDFQIRRLKHTHAALIADPRYHDATEFFLSDVYGGIDLTSMAREIERALPLATRLLPDSVLATSALACEIQVLTQALDEELTDLLFFQRGLKTLTVADYVDGFVALGNLPQRLKQADMVRELGHGLDRYVRSRVIYATFKIANKPAHRYGLGTLYDFLDRGFKVMRPMGSAHELFDTMMQSERGILERMQAGDPDPFGLGGREP